MYLSQYVQHLFLNFEPVEVSSHNIACEWRMSWLMYVKPNKASATRHWAMQNMQSSRDLRSRKNIGALFSSPPRGALNCLLPEN